jgi:hypothetical protein
MARQNISDIRFVKAVNRRRPDWDFQLPEVDSTLMKKLATPPKLSADCAKACTTTITLLPQTLVSPHSGVGYHMINIDGYRTLNAYVISDALNSTTQRGFSLEISFSLYDFVLNVGVVGETDFFFNFDTYFNEGVSDQPTLHCSTSDQTTAGGLPWIGGVDLTHILRVPVMGPYVRASVFNEDNTARKATVQAYLST